jgi:hypothetical protein
VNELKFKWEGHTVSGREPHVGDKTLRTVIRISFPDTFSRAKVFWVETWLSHSEGECHTSSPCWIWGLGMLAVSIPISTALRSLRKSESPNLLFFSPILSQIPARILSSPGSLDLWKKSPEPNSWSYKSDIILRVFKGAGKDVHPKALLPPRHHQMFVCRLLQRKGNHFKFF